jgi:hypothetical protein
MFMAVRVRGDNQNPRLMFPQHGFGLGVNRHMPAFREQFPPLFNGIAAGNKHTIVIGGDRPRVGTGFFPAAVIFQEAGDAAKADNCHGYFIHD